MLPAFADDKTELSQAKIEETVVIGLKRPINRKDYAGAVTLIDNDQLTASSVSNVVDIASLVPGLFAQDTGSRNPTPIIMRGINFDGMTSNNLGGDTYTVASYLDNIALQGYYAPPQVILKDLQAVDVLRGPQGTLYGASSLSGLISYQTAKPVMNEFSLDLHARISQTAESDDINMDSDIIINAPIVDDLLAMRAMISYSENAGFIDNDVLLTGPEKDINDDNVTAGRLSFLLTPTERLSATLMLQKQTTQSGDFQADNPAITGKDYFSSTYYLQPMEGELSLADLEIQYTFDSFTLELTSNYYAYDLTQTTDITAFYQDLGYTVDFDGGDNGFTESDVNDEQSNIELRAISNWQGSVNGIVGLSYTKNNFDITSKDNLSDFPGTYKEVEYTFTQDQTLEDTALFGELTWQTTEALALTLGGRYFDYNDTAESCDAFYTDPLFCISEEVDDSHTSFKLAGMYQINQALSLYANIAEGFRRGGANPGVPADLASRRSYDPDTAVNYEFGLLGQLWQQRLQLAVGVFYIDWKDIQLISGEEAENGDYISYIANANDAISQGVELELTAILSDSFTLRGYYAYNDAELAEDAVSYNDVEGGGDNGYKGDRLPGSPKQQAQLALQFLQPWQAYVFDASLSGNYTGDVSTQLNSEHFGYNTLDSYTLFNARLGIAQAQWRLGLFADNLTNKRVVTAEDPGYFGPESALSYVVRPRTLGIDVRYGF
ncbi:MAG: TonB-dependent receptor [Pseudomonadales bacterium]|nr:TonB-dependent receptor [Pseudomonadales bacterium]